MFIRVFPLCFVRQLGGGLAAAEADPHGSPRIPPGSPRIPRGSPLILKFAKRDETRRVDAKRDETRRDDARDEARREETRGGETRQGAVTSKEKLALG